jgi:hypothetical protein
MTNFEGWTSVHYLFYILRNLELIKTSHSVFMIGYADRLMKYKPCS